MTDKPQENPSESLQNQPQEPSAEEQAAGRGAAEGELSAAAQSPDAAQSAGDDAPVEGASDLRDAQPAKEAGSSQTQDAEAVQPSAEGTQEEPAEPVQEETAVKDLQQPTAEAEDQEPRGAETPGQEAAASEAQSAPADQPASDELGEERKETAGPDEQAGGAVPELTLGSGATAAGAELVTPGTIRGKVDKFGVAWGTGRRKTAVARVRVRDGNGLLFINGRRLEDYFKLEAHRQQIEAPLKATGFYGKVDVIVRVSGGGISGQAGAIALGIARALEAKQPTLHQVLSDGGYLTRDGRMVERKKYGLKKARKRPQFSKR